MFKILLSSSKPCLFVVLLYLGIFSTPQLMGQVVVQDGTGTCRVTVSTSTGVTVTYASGICTVKFTSIGADHLWTMPATGLQNVSFSIKGAGGGGGSSLPDGSYLQGAVFTGTVTQFNSSETYKIQVGSTTTTNLGGWPNGGLGGNNGTRGGGGATRLYDSGNNLILVAGGGGGHSGDSDPDGSTQGRDANGATGGLGGPGTESAGVAGSAAPNGTGGSSSYRQHGGGGGGYAGGGSGGKDTPTGPSNLGGNGGRGSSYINQTFASLVSPASFDLGSTNSTYAFYTNTRATSGEITFTYLPVQNLSIVSTGGDAGPTSGTNWSISGNTLTVSGGNATINESVLEAHLNAGNSLIVSVPGDIAFGAGVSISNTAGAATKTLTFTAGGRIIGSDYAITGSAGALNLVFITESDGGTSLGAQLGELTTNGGHVWVGGGSGQATWNGLTVGNGFAYSNGTVNYNAVDLYGNLTTAGGDVYIAANGQFNQDYAAITNYKSSNTDLTIDAGSGDITFLVDNPDFSATQATGDILLKSIGTISIAPLTTSNWDANFTFAYASGSASTTLTGSSSLEGLKIERLDLTTGFELGTWNGATLTGGYQSANTRDIILSSVMTIAGPISVFGGNITIDANLNTEAGNANGYILLKATGNITQNTNRTLSTNGGNVTLWADSDASSGGSIALGAAASVQSAGGRIILAGGLDNGSNGATANDGIPDGYARGIGVPGIATTSSFNLNAGSGSILARGSSDTKDGILLSASTTGNLITTGGSIDLDGFVDAGTVTSGQIQSGIRTVGGGTVTLDSGIGSINLVGNGPRHGLGFGITDLVASDAATQTLLKSANTTANAIKIKGTSGSGGHGISFRGASTKLHAIAALGGITIDAASPNWSSTLYNPLEVLAVSGPVTWLNSDATDGIYTQTSSIALGSKAGVTGLTTSSSNITFNLKKVSGNLNMGIGTTGNVTIQGVNGTGSFGQAFNSTEFGLNANGQTMSGFTFGSPANTQTLGINSALTVTGPVTAYGGAISVTAAINAAGNILLDGDTGSFLSQNTKGVTVAAAIKTTSNGTITILGRGGSGSSFSGTHGIDVLNLIEAGGTGSISLTGFGGLANSGVTSSNHGVNLDGVNAWVKSNGGNISINGTGGGASSGSYSQGLVQINSAKISAGGSGTINLTGNGGVNTAVGLRGIAIASSSSIFTAGGAINLTGIAGATGSDNSDGVLIDNATVGSNSSGHITLVGTPGGGTGSEAISISTNSTIGGASQTNDIVLRGNNFAFAGSNLVSTSGKVTVEPLGTSFSAPLTFPNVNLSIPTTVSGLTLGKATNTQNITFGSATSIAGPITATGGTIAINAAITATNSTINLSASTAVTQTAAITATNLALAGGGNFTLTNAANNIATLAAGTSGARIGNLSFVDASGGLEIGTVTSSGIFSSGTVLVQTEQGDLTLSQTINTTSTSDDAIILNAGRASSAGTASGGNILVSGSPTLIFPAAARAKLFSGRESLSTGLTTLVGGVANTRSGFDETSTFSPVLVDNTAYAIYRVAIGAGDLTVVSSGGDAENSTWSFDSGTRTLTTISIPVNVNASVIEGYLATGNLTIQAGNILVNSNVTSTTGNAFTLKSSGDIVLAASRSITTAGGDVILWANSDGATTNGSVLLRNESAITTNGGHVWMGGGSGSTTWNGLTVGNGLAVSGTPYVTPANPGNTPYESGIYLEKAAIQSGGGNVYLAGSSAGTDGSYDFGILTHDVSVINAGSGTITIKGGTGSSTVRGMVVGIQYSDQPGSLTLTSSSTQATAIDVDLRSASHFGLAFEGEFNLISTQSGGINFTTIGSPAGTRLGFSNVSTDNPGTLNVLAASGPIVINTGSSGFDKANNLSKAFFGSKPATSVTSSSSNIQFISDDLVELGAMNFATTGTLTVEPSGTSFAAHLNSNSFIQTGISGLTIGKVGNTANVTFGSATTIAGPITASGGTIAINAALTATNSTINLIASTAVTQTAAITATNLALEGGGNFTLTNASNNVATVAGGTNAARLGAVSFTDASGGLTLGTVGGASGVYASGNVLVETLSGDINLTEPVTTTSTTTTATGYTGAIVLNAGKNAASGTATGGDIKVSGNGAVSALSGITKLYSGSSTASTGLTTLVGGESNVRNGVDELTTTFTPVLSSSGGSRFALYRQNGNNALYTDGVNDFVLLSRSPIADGAEAFTIELWINPDGTNFDDTDYHGFIGFEAGGQVSGRNPSLWLKEGKIHLDAARDGDLARFDLLTERALVTPDRWTHVALVKDGALFKVYLDGSLAVTTAAPNRVNIATNNYWIGRVDNYFSGSIDEVRFWNDARTETEINALMNVPAVGNEAGLVAYYDFNQGVPGANNAGVTTLVDKTTGNNSGTLTNMALSGNTSNWVNGFFPKFTGNGYVYTGETTTLSHSTAGGTWSVNNTSLATISSSGVLSGVTAGQVVVTYTVGTRSTSRTVDVVNLANLGGITIVASGGANEGTGWAYSNGVIRPTSGFAVNVNASAVLSKLNLNHLTIEASSVTVNTNITSSYANDLTLKATGNIALATSSTITTAGGDVNLWSDSDVNSTGYVQLFNNAAINSNGGAINLGGGANLSTGYAFGTASETCPEVAPFTQYISGVHLRSGANLNSNGGNISIRGRNANTANSAMSFGISLRGVTINSGTGKLAINGVATGSGAVNAQGVATWGTLTLRSANTTADAISVTGDASGASVSALGLNLAANFEATGAGGGISLTGKVGAGTNGITGNILAASGPITISGESTSADQTALSFGASTVIGKKAGTNVLASSSQVILEGDRIVASPTLLVDVSGTLTVRPFGRNSFSDAFSWPMTNVSLASSITGLTLGKATNTSAITIGSTTTVSGPITLLGGDITVDGNINTSAGNANGDILVKATGSITQNSNRTVTTSGGDVIYWADADGNDSGDIFFGATSTYTNPASILTGGGHIWLGGGSGSSTWNGLTVGDGYAVGANNRTVGGSFTHTNGITIQSTILNSSGGDIYLKGKGKPGNSGSVYSGGMYLLGSGAMDSGGGDITVEALSNTGSGNKYGLYGFGPYTFAPGAGNLSITGDASASSAASGSSVTGRGIFFWTSMSPIVSSGNISLIGVKSSASGTHGIDIRTAITTGGNLSLSAESLSLASALSASGTLTLTTTSPLTYTQPLSANLLNLLGTGATYALTNTSNNAARLTANTGAINYLDTNALTLGQITATGEVQIATQTGDLILDGNLSSAATTASAVVVNAGKSSAAGTASGGDIKVSSNGAVSAPNGIVKLFSGKEATSTGLSVLVGGSAQERINVDETTTTFTPPLSTAAGSKYALYRSPNTISLTENTITLDALSAEQYTGSPIAALPVIKNGGTTLVKDTDYTLSYSGNTNVGTATVTATGIGAYSGTRTVNFTITKKPLTITGLTGVTKEYNGTRVATATGTAALSGIIGSDVVSLAGTPTYNFAQSEVGTGIAITTAGYTLTGAAAGNYSLTQPSLTANITAKALTITGLTGVTKEYNGTRVATATGTAALTGIIGSDVVSLTGTPTYTFAQAEVGTGIAITTTGYTLTGVAATNYTLTQPSLTANITAKAITITPNSNQRKVYGESDPVLTYTFSGALAGQTPGFENTLTRAQGEGAGGYAIGLGSLALSDNGLFKASNYSLVLTPGVDFTIGKAPLVARVNPDSKFVTQTDASGYAGLSYTGFEFGEGPSVLNTANLVISRTNAGQEAAGVYTNVLVASGITSANYTITYQPGSYTIIAADELLVKLGNREVGYGELPVYQVVSAGYYSSGSQRVVDLTSNTQVQGRKVTVTDGASGSAEFNIGLSSPALSGSGQVRVGTYRLAAENTVLTSANFSNKLVLQGNLEVKAKVLDVSLSSTKTKIYDGNVQMSSLRLALSTPLTGDVVSASGTGVYASKLVGETNYTVSGITLSGADGSNYVVEGGSGAQLTGTDGEITTRSLTVVPTGGQSKVFGGSDPIFTYTYSGQVSGEVPGFSGALSRATGEVEGAYGITKGTLGLVDNGGFLVANYSLEFTSGVNFTIGSKSIASGSVTVDPITELVYSGAAQTPAPVVQDGSTTLVSGTDYSLSYSNNTDAGTGVVTITGRGNYTGSRSVNFTIEKKAILITPTANQRKVYGEADPSLTYTFTGVISGQEAAFENTIDRASGQGAGMYALGLGNLTLKDNGVFKAANYRLELASLVNFTIDKAPLIAKVNADSKFVTQADATGYAGLSYTGFKAGESASVLNATNLVITRTNASQQAAGRYPNVLVASGLSSVNYEISYQAGDYTIVGADQLLMKLRPTEVIYGNSPQYQVEQVGYYSSGNQLIVNLTSSAQLSGTRLTVSDGASGTAVFDLAVASAQRSTSTNLKSGNYTMVAENMVETSPNFGNTVVLQGTLKVNPKQLSVTVSGGKVKGYDGNSVMQNLVLSLSAQIQGDLVSAQGSGQYASKNAGISGYSVSGITLSGADAANYFIQGGTNATVQGADGEITKRALTVMPNTGQKKSYGSADPVLTYTYTGQVQGEQLTFSGLLLRASGEAVGDYGITLGTLSAGANYELVLASTVQFEIERVDTDGDGVPDDVEDQEGTDSGDSEDAKDTDGDGVPDYIETQEGTDPTDGEDSKDTDGDGVPDYVEQNQGTDPANPTDSQDTDGDGVPDYTEEQQGTDSTSPTDSQDTDGDGVPDYIEEQQGTDPTNPTDGEDSDGDGVPDYVEEQQGTDPNDAEDAKDTDGDGVPDYVETVLWPNQGVPAGNPNTSGDDDRDSDGDGVPDYVEVQQGTDPNDSDDAKDTDGDGVPDYVETVLWPNQGLPAGNPNSGGEEDRDTDGDGVPDYVEVQQGTDPKNDTDGKDTDGDGVPDYVEEQQGTDPTDPDDAEDTDGDGVPDYVEEVLWPNQGLPAGDPNDPTDADRDTDGDGVPDYVEVQQGTDPKNDTDGKDTDGDGVPDYVEEQQGTNPNNADDAKDTDGDGVPDYVETVLWPNQGIPAGNPNVGGDQDRDTDGDGVPDYVEVQQGTDPKNATDGKDTDGDGVPDHIEVQQGTDPTDPDDAEDTDGDGVPDYVEEVLWPNQGLPAGNPNDPTDADRDTDGDGVPDYVEVQQGTDPKNATDGKDTDGDGVPDHIEVQQGTDPTDPDDADDSDGDGVPDYVETVLWPNQGIPAGNPNVGGDQDRDTDGDGIPDYIEVQQGTNPNDGTETKDSDGDGVPDHIEVQQGTDPTDPDDAEDGDGDGVPDYVETVLWPNQGLPAGNPNDPTDADRDTDGDGVPDYIEVQQGTNPTDDTDAQDSDGDGVPDHIEVAQGTDSNDPADATDTDGDGVPDYVETVLWPNQGLPAGNPNAAGDQDRDTDGDGVPDYIEVQQGTDPSNGTDAQDSDQDGVPDYLEILDRTDINDAKDAKDSDGDGVPDFVEIQQGTNPTSASDAKDSDGDGIPDYVENVQGTDPTDASDFKDTDRDGVPDYVEVQQGTSPTNATDAKDSDGDGVADHIQTRSIQVTELEQVVLVWGDKNYLAALPEQVEVTLFSGAKARVEVEWSKAETVNIFKRGSYELTGTLVLPKGMYNPYGVEGLVRVTILPKPAPRDVTINNSSFEGSTTSYFIPVGAFVVDDPVDKIHVVSLYGDGYDNRYFEIKDNILFWSSADPASGKTSFSIVVRVTDRDGNTIEKFFTITRTRKDFDSLTITNAYTPNGDGANDAWGVPELRFYQGVRIQIFDRGGNRVFYSENPDQRWDGTFEGKEMSIGTYYWTIEILETGEMRRGMLNLIRK